MNLTAAYAALITALIIVPAAAFAQGRISEHSFYAIVKEARTFEKNVSTIQDKIVRSQIEQRNLTQDFFRSIPDNTAHNVIRGFEEFLARDPGLYPEKIASGYFGFYATKVLVTFREQDRRRLDGIERPDTAALVDLLPLEKYDFRLTTLVQRVGRSL